MAIDWCFLFSTVLTERAELLVETESVKQQNTELRNLLHQYTTSTVSVLYVYIKVQFG